MKTGQRQVLTVDDDAELRSLIGRLLNDSGYGVREAVDGFQALRCLDQGRYDVVITDYRMPHMTGLELLEIIRVWWPDTSVIVLSGEPVQTAQLVLQGGAFAWLPKPFGLRQLMETVERASSHASGLRHRRGGEGMASAYQAIRSA